MNPEKPTAQPLVPRRVLFASLAACGLLAATGSGGWAATYGPQNTVTVVDPSPVNWLSITWNTMEERLRLWTPIRSA